MFRVQIQNVSDFFSYEKRRLSGCPNIQVAGLGVKHGKGAVSLQADGGDNAVLEGPLHNMRGRSEGCVNTTKISDTLLGHVAGQAGLVMDCWRVCGLSGLGIQYGRQHFVIDGDGADGGLRLGGRLSGDGGNLLAHEPNLTARHGVAVGILGAGIDIAPVREICTNHHNGDTRHGPGRRKIDLSNAGMGMRTAENRAMEHTR